jgi:hypothetical protein
MTAHPACCCWQGCRRPPQGHDLLTRSITYAAGVWFAATHLLVGPLLEGACPCHCLMVAPAYAFCCSRQAGVSSLQQGSCTLTGSLQRTFADRSCWLAASTGTLIYGWPRALETPASYCFQDKHNGCDLLEALRRTEIGVLPCCRL